MDVENPAGFSQQKTTSQSALAFFLVKLISVPFFLVLKSSTKEKFYPFWEVVFNGYRRVPKPRRHATGDASDQEKQQDGGLDDFKILDFKKTVIQQ